MSAGVGEKEEKYDYWNDPAYLPAPELPQEPDPHKDLPVAERVIKYKEEGNKIIAKDPEKAIMWYTRAIQTPHRVPEDRAVFFCNRAAAQLTMQNYRSALEDAEAALSLNPSAELRLKALFRASKGALGCGGSAKLALALKYCKEALEMKKSNDLVKLEGDIQAMIKKELKKQDDKEEKANDKKEMTKLFQEALSRRGWALGKTLMYQTPFNDSKKIGVGYSDKEDLIFFPVIFMYPQYRQSDLIEACSEHDTLTKWFDKLFPRGQPPMPWDSERLFVAEKLSELCIFAKTNDYPQNTRKQKWMRVDPSKELGQIFFTDPEYVIPRYPVFFIVHRSYEEKFLSLQIGKVC